MRVIALPKDLSNTFIANWWNGDINEGWNGSDWTLSRKWGNRWISRNVNDIWSPYPANTKQGFIIHFKQTPLRKTLKMGE